MNKDKQAILRQGQKGEFWLIIKEHLEEQQQKILEELQSDKHLNTPFKEYKLQHELLKSRLLDIKTLLDLPNVIIMALEEPDNFTPDFETYSTPEDFAT